MKIIFIIFALNFVSSASAKHLKPLRLFGRHYVQDVLLNVFGKKRINELIISKYIMQKGLEFGDPCVVNEQIFIKDPARPQNKKLLDDDSSCQGNLSLSKNNFGSLPSASRNSLHTKACEELSNIDSNIEYILKKIEIKDAFTEPSEEGLQKLQELFYPGGVLSSEVLQALLSIGGQSKLMNKDRWRYIILTLCLSEYWAVN